MGEVVAYGFWCWAPLGPTPGAGVVLVLSLNVRCAMQTVTCYDLAQDADRIAPVSGVRCRGCGANANMRHADEVWTIHQKAAWCPGCAEDLECPEEVVDCVEPDPVDLNLSVKGRGQLSARLVCCDGRVYVRLDDAMRPDWWAEVQLDGAALVVLDEYTNALPEEE